MYWRNEINDILSNDISFIFFVLQLITSSKPIFEAMFYGSWNTIWMACISPPSAVVQPRAAILFRCYGNGWRAFLLSIYLAVTSRQIFPGRVYAVMSPFPSYTPHVPAKPKTLSRQNCYALLQSLCKFSSSYVRLHQIPVAKLNILSEKVMWI
jgi:hypothetical protein